jgi:phycocyanobilin:ferredoxin oxidoreductase
MASGLYKTLVREWRNDAHPVALPAAYRELKSPLMHIRNATFSSDIFRKVHVEYVTMNPSLEIVHHTAFPKPWFDIPILGMDVIFRGGVPSMVIADLSSDQHRDPWIGLIPQLMEFYDMSGSPRDLPEWGRRIFSEECLFVDDPSPDVLNALLHLRASYAAGCAICKHHTRNVSQYHTEYCMQQRKNKKTRGLLTAAFGWDVATQYMRDVMFDF